MVALTKQSIQDPPEDGTKRRKTDSKLKSHRRKAEELDRTTKKCMESGIAAIQGLQRAKWSTTTRGFRSFALEDNRVQEAASKYGRDTEEMIQAANRRPEKERGKQKEARNTDARSNREERKNRKKG